MRHCRFNFSSNVVAISVVNYWGPVAELQCFVCGKKTGCNKCKYLNKCEARMISKYCICNQCSKQEESFLNYKTIFAAKIMKFSK